MTIALTLTQTSVEAKGPIEVSIVIATQRRPQSLRRAVASVLAQASVETATLELVVASGNWMVETCVQRSGRVRNAPRCACNRQSVNWL